MDMKNAYTPVVIGVVVGLVAGFAAGWYWTENKYENIDTDHSHEEEGVMLEGQMPESMMQASAGNEAITVSAQSPGSVVVVDEVTLSEAGWVAVREVVGGEMGNILGATRIQNPGTISKVSVELLRPTVENEVYAVVIYRDNGDADFDFNFDALVVRGSQPVSATFQTK